MLCTASCLLRSFLSTPLLWAASLPLLMALRQVRIIDAAARRVLVRWGARR